ncbi:YIP1 family protein [Bowmanella sp. JS7-9]|uniref:YIP1 family protein n=1 Tax=Pseudobowmanella zhangzhouensis TaxID=1537679 RepID=A0ABW1XPX1_9ALTE|nr:YIP1 family protein [Bowmanella sp. JS7-9]
METSQVTLNPWFSMWTRPRATIQQIVTSDPFHLVLLLSAVSGFLHALDRASMRDMGDKYDITTIIAIAAISGPIGGIIGLYLGGALLRWVGNWMGGTGSSETIRAAIAWSSVPVIWAGLLWIPAIAMFGDVLFTSDTSSLDGNLGLAVALIVYGLIEIVIGVWAIVVFLKCLGQVQGFSAWMALANSIVAMLVVAVPIVMVVLLFTSM